MIPEASLPEIPSAEKERSLSTTSPLSAMLVFPIPQPSRQKRSFWMQFLRDLTFTIPLFGLLLGSMLITGQAPFIGSTIIIISVIALALRAHAALEARRERKRIEALEKWYRAHLCDSLYHHK